MSIVPRDPDSPPEKPVNEGSVLKGCLMGCAAQIIFFFVGLAASGAMRGKWGAFAFVSWGITQWIAIIPLIFNADAEGHTSTKQGLLIAGSLGVLLSAACGSMVVGSWR